MQSNHPDLHLESPVITRHRLALYCAGSGDHSPLHVDLDFARNDAGLDDVIGHGMLTMAYLGEMLARVYSIADVREFSVRFLGQSKIGDRIVCDGKRAPNEDGGRIRIELQATTPSGLRLAKGYAIIETAE